MSKIPKFIWLQLYGDSSPDDGAPPDVKTTEITWCWEPIFEHDVKYQLVSDIDPLLAENEANVNAAYLKGFNNGKEQAESRLQAAIEAIELACGIREEFISTINKPTYWWRPELIGGDVTDYKPAAEALLVVAKGLVGVILGLLVIIGYLVYIAGGL